MHYLFKAKICCLKQSRVPEAKASYLMKQAKTMAPEAKVRYLKQNLWHLKQELGA